MDKEDWPDVKGDQWIEKESPVTTQPSYSETSEATLKSQLETYQAISKWWWSKQANNVALCSPKDKEIVNRWRLQIPEPI